MKIILEKLCGHEQIQQYFIVIILFYEYKLKFFVNDIFSFVINTQITKYTWFMVCFATRKFQNQDCDNTIKNSNRLRFKSK